MSEATIKFLEGRLESLRKEIKAEVCPTILRFTLETYLTTKKLVEKLKNEQEAKAVPTSEDVGIKGI